MAEKPTTAWSGHHPAKDRLRAAVWEQLKVYGAALGEPVGHIPRFVGADQAAARLAALPVWQQARVIKSNPDTAQEPVRRRALQDGKIVYMAVPRLTQERCFVELSPDDLRQPHQNLHGIRSSVAGFFCSGSSLTRRRTYSSARAT